MQSPKIEPTNPLGLNLDFIFGRGYLWAERERLSDWITLELLRMEIPDLSFPFDARGGLQRFRNTRCLVREIELSISEVGLGDLLRQAAAELERFSDLEVRFLDDAAHISARVDAMGADTFVSFRAALIPPEPARADEIHLSLYDYRAYGPLPFPARLVAFELMTGLLNTDYLRPPGRGESFTVGIAGDILSFRPLKLILLHIFARVGWKLPNLSDIVLDGARIRPGALTIRAGTRDQAWLSAHAQHRAPVADFALTQTREGARALGAYEAKDLFVHADQALFDGQLRQAMHTLGSYRDIYGLHSELVSRTLDCLLADPNPANLAEADALCAELQAQNPDDLRALIARPTITALANPGDRGRIIQGFERLAASLRARGDTQDWILAQLSLAAALSAENPRQATLILREVLKISPRNRVALEKLRALYQRSGDENGLEEVLKRLTGVYIERDALKETYLSLADLLMSRERRRAELPEVPGAMLGAAGGDELREARLYLEKVLRLDPAALDALDTLGESYVRSDEPLRALKAFGSAARSAEADGDPARAAHLLLRVARLWRDELGDPQQALMSCRRALNLAQPHTNTDTYTAPGTSFTDPKTQLDLLEFSAEICAAEGLLAEAGDYWLEAIPLLEAMHEEAQRGVYSATEPASAAEKSSQDAAAARLIAAHRQIAALYQQRGREDQARAHHERVLELDPEADFYDLPSADDAPAPTPERSADKPAADPPQRPPAPENTVPGAMLEGRNRPDISDISAPQSAPAGEGAATPEDSDGEDLAAFRQRYRELFLAKKAKLKAQAADDSEESPADSLGAAEESDPEDLKETAPLEAIDSHILAQAAQRDEAARGTQEPAGVEAASGESELRQAVAAARGRDAPAALAQAIDRLIEAHFSAQSALNLEHDELMRLSLELGELYYYDLEDIAASRAHLERVRDQDPGGLGTRPTLLTTLEAIYEEVGAFDERVQLLKARLAQSESVEMGITYRLLIAQLLWDGPSDLLGSAYELDEAASEAASGARAGEAQPWLEEILQLDPQNEAAHRLLAQIAGELEDYERAAKHLERALKVAGGGLDAIELERDLGQLLLEKLDRPTRAKRHFERVLEAAPGDSIALDAIKSCQAASGDWAGYITSLGRELGLLTGRPEGLNLQDMLDLEPAKLSAAIRPAASQIVADAAHILDADLSQAAQAWQLWGLGYALWPENVDALEQRIALDRALDKSAALAQDLESLAELLLDSHARFDALDEAARLYAGPLEQPERARPLFAEAVALVQDDAEPPAGLDQARRALRGLQLDEDS